MSFLITARTILHLGSDLISSDAVALYELIKNAIDARSKNGVDIQFDIVIRESDFSSVMSLLDDTARHFDLDEIRQRLLEKVNSDADSELKDQFVKAVTSARTIEAFKNAAYGAYRRCNRIVISDTGHGMTRGDLKDIYLTIGTTHRAAQVREAIRKGEERPPYLGEKGVGRLSVMRLGWCVRIETVTEQELETNVLEIDWRKFEEADDAAASSVHLEPKRGVPKVGTGSFTRITITDLRSSWSATRLAQIANEQIARITDPFSWSGRRFQIRLKLNGASIQPIRAVVKELLDHAHSKCSGKFNVENGRTELIAKIESSLYGGGLKEIVFDLTDLMSMAGLRESGQSSAVLRTTGSFSFEFYWFNRQRLRALPDVGDREAVKRLVKMWAGVSLFRDGYRVLPYGDEGDDWLGLDLTALASSGYKLNTKQIIGRVSIGRLSNPRLLDQTNRQGLIETPEKDVLIVLLRELISRWWHRYLNEALMAQKRTELLSFDSGQEASAVDDLEARATRSLKAIRQEYKGESQLLRDVKDAFVEIRDAHQRAIQRILTIEEEKERLTQLAGVGLMVEVIAHELTRATELTQATLKDLNRRDIDADVAAALKTLSTQIKVIQKRLQSLEPLSITARFHRARMCLANVVAYVFEGHADQFSRHNVEYTLSTRSDLDAVAFIVEGHVVQILENLVSNSIYWLDMERKEHPAFQPKIKVKILSNPSRIVYFDNGPGIPQSRRDSVFEPFFSTKSGSKSRRQGLGLYIARQNAEALGGTLELIDIGNPHEGRFNTFQLELKEGADESK